MLRLRMGYGNGIRQQDIRSVLIHQMDHFLYIAVLNDTAAQQRCGCRLNHLLPGIHLLQNLYIFLLQYIQQTELLFIMNTDKGVSPVEIGQNIPLQGVHIRFLHIGGDDGKQTAQLFIVDFIAVKIQHHHGSDSCLILSA